jgi:hypothetical protein
MYEMIAGASEVELQIDSVEEPTGCAVCTQEPENKEAAAKVTAYILKRTELDDKMEQGLMRGANFSVDPCIDHLNFLFNNRGKVKVWIYNVSHQEHLLGNGLIKKMRVPACKDGEEYAVVASLPAVMITSKENVDTGEFDYLMSDGRRMAMDLINPSNLGINQDAEVSSWFASGNNFSSKGVFFSTHNPPLKKEIRAAHKRLKPYYEDIIERANLVRLTSIAGTLGITLEEIEAAQDYIGIIR